MEGDVALGAVAAVVDVHDERQIRLAETIDHLPDLFRIGAPKLVRALFGLTARDPAFLKLHHLGISRIIIVDDKNGADRLDESFLDEDSISLVTRHTRRP